jgi:hypothetical protein
VAEVVRVLCVRGRWGDEESESDRGTHERGACEAQPSPRRLLALRLHETTMLVTRVLETISQ